MEKLPEDWLFVTLNEIKDGQLRHAAEMRLSFEKINVRAEQIKADLIEHEKSDLETQGKIDKRLEKMEGLHRSVTWVTRVGLGAIFTLIVDLIRNHLPAFLSGK